MLKAFAVLLGGERIPKDLRGVIAILFLLKAYPQRSVAGRQSALRRARRKSFTGGVDIVQRDRIGATGR